MICARRSRKRTARCNLVAWMFAFTISLASAGDLGAQSPEQFQKHAAIGGRLQTSIFMVGWKSDARDIEKLFDIVISRTNDVFSQLDWQNPQGEVARLNASSGGLAVPVSPEVLAAFTTAKKISEWSKGAFDIAYAGQGSWRDIKIDEGASTVQLKSAGMQVRFDGMIEGFLADAMVNYIYAANMRSAIVKIGNAFRGIGRGVYGPWKVHVEDDAGTFARHALNLTVQNTGVAAVSANQFRGAPIIDPRSKSQIESTCKGNVVVMKEAALAQGIAQAIFVLGPSEGMKLLSKMGKGLIVGNDGQFMRSPGF